jgi:hypothetical protein
VPLHRNNPSNLTYVGYNYGVKPYRFTRSSRRHRIGRTSVRHVIEHTDPNVATDKRTGATTYAWIGPDERGRELEVVGIDRPDCVLIVHVMPTHYRTGS